MVFDGGDSYCTGSGGSFTGSEPVVGFMWAAIYDVKNSGSTDQRTVKMRLEVMDDHVVRGRGSDAAPDYGVVALGTPTMAAP
jgi:hypothetical protein